MLYLWVLYITATLHLTYWYLTHKTALKEFSPIFKEKYYRLYWNSVLLLGFLGSAVTGLIMANRAYYPVITAHRISGMVIVVTAAMHVLERLNFFEGFIREYKHKHKDEEKKESRIGPQS